MLPAALSSPLQLQGKAGRDLRSQLPEQSEKAKPNYSRPEYALLTHSRYLKQETEQEESV